MKKALALLLSLALTVTSFMAAFVVKAAEPKITSTVSATDIKMGDTFTITVSVSDYEPVKSGALSIEFDQSVLEIVSGEWLIGAEIESFDPERLNAVFMFFPNDPHDINGDIFRYTLRALSDATSAGDFDITITPQFRNENDENVAEGDTTTTKVNVSCTQHQYGELVPEVPAKCGVEGKKTYYECSVCHKLFDENMAEVTADQLVIPALTHVAEEGWHSDGDNHWKICINNGCGQVIEGTTAGHSFNWVVDKPATEDETGIRHEECTVCGFTRNENTEIPKLDHVHTGITHHPAVAANCHQTGTIEYWTCSSDKCAGKYYGDADCTTEITSITTSVDSNHHDGDTEIRNAVEATCGADGYTGDTYCLGCNQKIADGTVIPATGAHVDADGNWESDGTDHWHTCECGAIFDKAAHEGGEATCSAKAVCIVCEAEYGELDPDNHVNTEIRDAVAATEESEGYTGDTWCLDCEKMIEEGTVISKLDHTHAMGKTEAKAATCEEDGNIEYYTCSKCGKKYSDEAGTYELTDAEIIVKATGHSFGTDWESDADHHWHECICGEYADVAAHTFGDWTVTQDATATTDGTRERECTVCGYVQQEVINALGGSSDVTEPDGTNTPGDPDSPQTGDHANIVLWLVLLVAGGCGVTITITAKKKYKMHK